MTPGDPSTWPPELDALVAAPEHHTLIFENERVRVLRTKIAPGGKTRLHTHRWPAVVHLVSMSDFVRRDDQGNVVLDSRVTKPEIPSGSTTWAVPYPPHSLENVGEREILVIAVELKDRASA